ncbi:MAG: transporter [Deltaproteobacteria bacterium]
MRISWFTLTSALAILLLAVPLCHAVDFYDGARAPEGLYFLTYSSLYSAGNKYRKFEETFRLSWYDKDWVLTGLFPFGKVKSCGRSSSGTGDSIAGAGHFLPVRTIDILPMLFVKFPTGEYTAGKPVNYGTNQYDVRPAVFLYKSLGRFSVDAAAKYYVRERNPATKKKPGDELYLQGLLGWQLTRECKAGPAVNWMESDNGRESLSLGGDIYLRLPFAAVTLTWLHDARTRNTIKGDFVQVKTCTRF